MPWSPAQVKLFQAAAHNPSIAASHGLTPQNAAQMASEGVAPAPQKKKQLAQGLRKYGR